MAPEESFWILLLSLHDDTFWIDDDLLTALQLHHEPPVALQQRLLCMQGLDWLDSAPEAFDRSIWVVGYLAMTDGRLNLLQNSSTMSLQSLQMATTAASSATD